MTEGKTIFRTKGLVEAQYSRALGILNLQRWWDGSQLQQDEYHDKFTFLISVIGIER